VGVVEALSRLNTQVKRLLGLAKAWPKGLPEVEAAAPRSYRTARQLRPDEITKLVRAYETGATVYDLAARYKINRRTVGKHLRAQGVDTTPPGLPPDDIPAAAKLYEQGWSLARIAEKFDAAANTVRARLLEAGVAMRDTHGRER
jgi:DNA-binding NarL/FixJ family response regulator